MKQKRLHVQILAASSLIAEYDEFDKCIVFVGDLFTFNLPPVSIERTQKLLIELSNEIDAEFIFPSSRQLLFKAIYLAVLGNSKFESSC